MPARSILNTVAVLATRGIITSDPFESLYRRESRNLYMEPADVERLLRKMRTHLKSIGEKADLARIREIIAACEPQSLEEAFEHLKVAHQNDSNLASNKITRPIPKVLFGGVPAVPETKQRGKLTPEQKLELVRKLKEGNKEFETLAATYILQKASRIAARFGNNPEDIEDFVQSSFIEVRKALKNCDEAKIRDVDAYIEKIICSSMQSQFSGRHGRLGLSRYDRDNIKKIEKSRTVLQRELGREPTIKELSRVTALSEDKVRQYQQLSSQSFVVSLDETLSDDDDAHSIVDELSYEEDQDLAIELACMDSWLGPLFSKLSENEQTVLRLRFSEPALSLSEIGLQMGVTKQWVQQVQTSALSKLKAGAEEVRANRITNESEQVTAQDKGQKIRPVTDWLTEIVLSKVNLSRTRFTQDELVPLIDRSLKRNILLYEEGSDSVEPLPYDEVLHWLIGHLIADGRLAKNSHSGHLSITAAGTRWLKSY